MKKATTIGLLLLLGSAFANADVIRHPLPNNSTFPIAQAVEVSAGTTLVYHSGTLPGPANPDAEQGSREFWGDTEAQANSVFENMAASLEYPGFHSHPAARRRRDTNHSGRDCLYRCCLSAGKLQKFRMRAPGLEQLQAESGKEK